MGKGIDQIFHVLQAFEEIVSSIKLDSPKQLQLPEGTGNATETVKRPAPKAGGCRIEGHVRVKKVRFTSMRKYRFYPGTIDDLIYTCRFHFLFFSNFESSSGSRESDRFG